MAPSSSRGTIQEATQLREGLLTGTLTGQKINYLDSGYSEEDADQQVTSCLMKTSSGSIYIPPSKKKIHMSTFHWFKRLFYFFLLYMYAVIAYTTYIVGWQKSSDGPYNTSKTTLIESSQVGAGLQEWYFYYL